MKDYCNDIYWKKNLENNKNKSLDFLNNLWISKYDNELNQIKDGKVLDLGCGLGQYTKYFLEKGFDVVSTDISSLALVELEKNINNAKVIQMDMEQSFPFNGNEFDIVFANLSIHYSNEDNTKKILSEVNRVLKKDGYFIGSVNSSKTLPYVKGEIKELEPNYYHENNRNTRYFDKEQFNYFFKDFNLIKLDEITTTRWDLKKVIWEFVYKKK